VEGELLAYEMGRADATAAEDRLRERVKALEEELRQLKGK
jgi:hypothetical protein